MAQLSLDVTRWRMLRMALKQKRFAFEDLRLWVRRDRTHFDWLVAEGFFVQAADGRFEVTLKGVAAADLGYYEWEPPARETELGQTPGRKRGKK
jgi:hypothetical protein